MAIPLEWKASITGVEDVKSKLSDLNQEYRNGQIGVEEYSTKARFLTSTLRNVNSGFNQQKQILLATHPILNQLSRGFSIFSSVMHSALSIMNALNISRLNNNQINQQLLDVDLELLEVRKQMIGILDKNSIAYKLLEQQETALLNKAKEIKKENEAQYWEDIKTQIIALSTAFAVIGTKIVPIIAFFKDLGSSFAGVLGVGASLSKLLSGGLGLQGLAFFVAQIPDMLSPAIAEWHRWWVDEGFRKTFLVDLPNIFIQGFTFIRLMFIGFMNLIIGSFNSMLNAVIGGIGSLVNGAIHALNHLIARLNKIPGVRIGLVPDWTVPSISVPFIQAASGFEGIVNQPTMFLAGEAGSEAVSIRPTGSTGGQLTIIVQGSILAERDLERIADKALKRDLKRVGSF